MREQLASGGGEEQEEEEEMPRAWCPMPPHPSQLLPNESHSADASTRKGPPHDLDSLQLLHDESHSAGASMPKAPSHDLDSLLLLLHGSTPSNTEAHSLSSTGACHASLPALPEKGIAMLMDDSIMDIRTPEAFSSAHDSPTGQPVSEHSSGQLEQEAVAAQDTGDLSPTPMRFACNPIREHASLSEQAEHKAVQDQEAGSLSPAPNCPAGQPICHPAPNPGPSGSPSESAAVQDQEAEGLSSATRSPASQSSSSQSGPSEPVDPSPAASEQAGSLFSTSSSHSDQPSIIVKGMDELDGLLFRDEAASGEHPVHTQAPCPEMKPIQASLDLAESIGRESVVTSSPPEGSGLHALASQSPTKQQGASATGLSQTSPTADAVHYAQAGTGSHGMAGLSSSSRCNPPEQLDVQSEPLLQLSSAYAKASEYAADPSSSLPPEHNSYNLDTSIPEVNTPGLWPAAKAAPAGGTATIATSSPQHAGSSAALIQPDDHQEDSNEGFSHDAAPGCPVLMPLDTASTGQPGCVYSLLEEASADAGLQQEAAREAAGGAGGSKRSCVLLDWALDQQQVRIILLPLTCDACL